MPTSNNNRCFPSGMEGVGGGGGGLKRHTDKGTCPVSFRYKARANVKADEQFKSDVKRIRKEAEQDFVHALTRFHQRQISSFKRELQQGKRPRNQNVTAKKASHKKVEQSASSDTIVQTSNVNRIANNLMEKLGQCNEMFAKLQEMTNKQVEKYTGSLPEYRSFKQREKGKQMANKMRKKRRKNTRTRRNKAQLEANKKHIKNLSNKQLTEDQINLLGKGLKFIPTPVTKHDQIRRQLLRDFEQFARRMRLQNMYHGEENEPHPFYMKSKLNPPVQKSVALESYLEEVKLSLAEINLTKPKK